MPRQEYVKDIREKTHTNIRTTAYNQIRPGTDQGAGHRIPGTGPVTGHRPCPPAVEVT